MAFYGDLFNRSFMYGLCTDRINQGYTGSTYCVGMEDGEEIRSGNELDCRCF